MARQVLPWVGAIVGAYFGNPQLGFAIGSMIGNAVDPQVINGPKLGEGQDNNASEGGYRPIVLGKGAVGVCMIHEGPLKKRTIRHKQSKGSGPVTTEERAYRTMAFGLGESAYPDTGVQLSRLWIDNKLRYDVTPTSQIVQESEDFANEFTFYPGNNTQNPDPDIEAFLGAGNVSSYRGGAPYIVFPDWDVTDSRGMAPMIKAELLSSFDPIYPLMASRQRLNGVSSILKLDEEWSGSWRNVDFNPNNLCSASGGRVVVQTATLQPFQYTDDLGENFQESSGANTGGSAGVKSGWCFGGTCLMPGSSQAVRMSTNNGTSFATIAETGLNVIIREHSDLPWIGASVSVFKRSSNGVTWSGGGSHGISGSTGLCAGPGDDRAWLGGTESGSSPQEPRLVWINESSMSAESLPAVSGATKVTAVYERGGILVVGFDNGQIAVKSGGSWSLPYSEDLQWNQITHNRREFVAIGSKFGGEGVIASSTDGVSWTVRRREAAGVQDIWRSIVPIRRESNAQKITLASIVSWIHDRVQIDSAKYSTAQLTDLVEGVVFADGYTAADALRTQMSLYFFDAGEYDAGSGYRINYVKRGGSADVTLTEADIVDGPEDWEREDSYERPKTLHVSYQNPIADYGAPNITIKRTSPDVLVVGERSAAVPNVFSDVDEITRRADVMMTVVYAEIAGEYEITLPVSWLQLAPTDCIGFSIRGRSRRLRLTSWRFSPDGTIKTEWMADRQSAYTSNLTGLPVVPPTRPPPSIVGPTVSAVLDIPALVDALDSLHLVVAASGQTEAWYGAIHQRRLPFDADFTPAAQFNPPTTIMGLLDADVSGASPHYTDGTNVVKVTLYSNDDLDTYTQQQLLSENGAFALAWDDAGVRRWEVCQYRDAVKVGEMKWELSTLLRGRLNTGTAAHPAGSLFVLLDAGVRVMPMQSAWIGEDIEHRAVSYGQSPEQAIPYTEPYSGESQREWPVANLFVERNGDHLECVCIPRHRFGTDDHPVRSQNWESYRWIFTDGSNTSTVGSIVDSIEFDVTGWATPVTVSVAQINRITGPGPYVSEVVE